jgi:hypothetical protein
MLNIGDHRCWTIAWVDIKLLNTGVATDGEEGGSGTIVANGSDAVGSWHRFIGHSLGTYVPGACLAAMANVSMMER